MSTVSGNGSNGQQDWRSDVQCWIRLRGTYHTGGAVCARCGRKAMIVYAALFRADHALSGPYCDGPDCAAPDSAPFEHALPLVFAPPKIDVEVTILVTSARNNLAAAQDTLERMAADTDVTGANGYVEVYRSALAIIADQLDACRQRIAEPVAA